MTDPVIRVEKVSKQYRIGKNTASYGSLRDSLAHTLSSLIPPYRKSQVRSSDSDSIWALKDVSFEIKRGEVLGVIGHNGAGKSTLLKILSRITKPTTGRAIVRGRVGSLLEVGTGFHPELTGRENVFLNGAILGMRKAEIQRKFDEIVGFSGVEEFIDTPVKHYSSGMYVRLAFSVAAHLETEILLVDEVLAVGDARFQKKCLGKMGDIAGEGRTILFVSHNLAMIERLCEKSVLLDKGRIKSIGTPNEIIHNYSAHDEGQRFVWVNEHPSENEVQICKLTLFTEKDYPAEWVTSDDEVGVDIECSIPKDNPDLQLGAVVFDSYDRAILSTAPIDFGESFPVQRGLHRYRVLFPKAFFMPQRYSISVSIYSPGIGLDHCDRALVIDVEEVASLANSGVNMRPGIVQIICKWQHSLTKYK